MSNVSPEAQTAAIVLLGSFNPRIFQPAWLAQHALIRNEEAERATGVVFSEDIAVFTCDWLSIHVTKDRFTAATENAEHVNTLRDLVLGTFSLLEHTPFNKMGLNRSIRRALLSVRIR